MTACTIFTTIPPYFPNLSCLSLELTLRPNNLPHHEMLMAADFLARDDHNQIPHIANLMLIMCHKFFSKPAPLAIFGHDAVPVDCNIHCLLHLVAYYLANQGSTGVVARRVVNEVPSRDGRHVGEFLIRHVL